METLKIELRFYASNQDQIDAIREAGRQAAKHLKTVAALVTSAAGDGRAPEVAMTNENFFEGTAQIDLADDLVL